MEDKRLAVGELVGNDAKSSRVEMGGDVRVKMPSLDALYNSTPEGPQPTRNDLPINKLIS